MLAREAASFWRENVVAIVTLVARIETFRARSIQPKFPEILVQNSMDRFGPTGKVSKKRVHLLRGPLFPVEPVGILVEWIAPLDSRTRKTTSTRFDSREKFILPFFTRKVSTVICSEGGFALTRSQNDKTDNSFSPLQHSR